MTILIADLDAVGYGIVVTAAIGAVFAGIVTLLTRRDAARREDARIKREQEIADRVATVAAKAEVVAAKAEVAAAKVEVAATKVEEVKMALEGSTARAAEKLDTLVDIGIRNHSNLSGKVGAGLRIALETAKAIAASSDTAESRAAVTKAQQLYDDHMDRTPDDE
jgi:hypothetical protein